MSDFMAIRENTEGLDDDHASENRAADTTGLLNTTCEGFLAPPQLNPNLIIYKKRQERIRNMRNRDRLNATGDASENKRNTTSRRPRSSRKNEQRGRLASPAEGLRTVSRARLFFLSDSEQAAKN